jgi:CRISPR-associated protein Cas1
MYDMRFGEPLPRGLTIEQIRGREGHRVRSAYQRAGEQFKVEWKARSYDPGNWHQADPLNRALSAGSACLNGLVHAGIAAAGYSTALGFIHTGKMLSFVYDVADLYKVNLVVPIAFRVVAESDKEVERRTRLECRNAFGQSGLIRRIVPDIAEVLNVGDDPGASAGESAGGAEPVDDRAEGRDIPWTFDRQGA